MNLQPVIALLWSQYGPYHFARAGALARLAGKDRVKALELANVSSLYRWDRQEMLLEVITISPNSEAEKLSFGCVFHRTRRKLVETGAEVCLLPSYSPSQSLAALLAAKSLGLGTVMMNESHAGTARATGLLTLVKRCLIGLFDAALVGGAPQKRYFEALGLPAERIFVGYDAVDNDYFAKRVEEVQSRQAEYRQRYALPAHYFLSLGRFVPKKNLGTLIQAYRGFLDASPASQTHLVMVGSGEEEAKLRSLCHELELSVCDHSAPESLRTPHSAPRAPSVHFHGFRQIEENPVFYALSDAFILPSLWEEWGLVVNEAMASGLPVAVSETAGCAEDLLEAGYPTDASPEDRTRIEQSGLALKVRQNGFLFNPRSAEELSRVLMEFEASSRLRVLMGAESQRIVEKFSCANFARNAMRAVEAAQSKARWVLTGSAPMKPS
jgi:glycosyltransferase involved in cell wall biosynthesis